MNIDKVLALKASKETENILKIEKAAFINGQKILFQPIYAMEYGLNDALVYCQLLYRAESSKYKDNDLNQHLVRFSYTKIQKQVPFLSKRTIIRIVARLENKGAIKVIKTSRVNKIVVYDKLHDGNFMTNITEELLSNMILYPKLALLIGVNEAIVIQQIHIRHCFISQNWWVIRPYRMWQSDILPFMSISVIKRTFARLKAMNLIFVKKYSLDDFDTTNSYRVNYLKIAELLNYPKPLVKKGKSIVEVTNPKGF